MARETHALVSFTGRPSSVTRAARADRGSHACRIGADLEMWPPARRGRARNRREHLLHPERLGDVVAPRRRRCPGPCRAIRRREPAGRAPESPALNLSSASGSVEAVDARQAGDPAGRDRSCHRLRESLRGRRRRRSPRRQPASPRAVASWRSERRFVLDDPTRARFVSGPRLCSSSRA